MATNPNDPFEKEAKFDPVEFPSAQGVIDFHTNADTDKHAKAIHHTLGTVKFTAADGAHTHDGKDSRKLGSNAPLVLTGAKAGNVALANLITLLRNYINFTDSTT